MSPNPPDTEPVEVPQGCPKFHSARISGGNADPDTELVEVPGSAKCASISAGHFDKLSVRTSFIAILMSLPLGIYIHWPFCQSRCPYCAFNTYVRQNASQEPYVQALCQELTWFQKATKGHFIHSIFFGGGTPSLLEVSSIETILDTIHALWSVSSDVEISLEANPSSVETERLTGYRHAGINRISLGIQSLHDDQLRFLGRRHTVSEALHALECAQALFKRVSFDLIYARPGQSVTDWEKELRQALSFGTEHLSLYQLTMEPETPFARLHTAGKLVLPQEDLSAELYSCTRELCAEAGLPAYEVSNHARGRAAQSRHNLIYWRAGEYIGVGPGAHGRFPFAETQTGKISRHASEIMDSPEKWLAHVKHFGHGLETCVPLSPAACAEESLLMGLRLHEGICLTKYQTSGYSLNQDALTFLIEEGFLTKKEVSPRNMRLVATEKGILVLNTIIAELVNDE